MGHDSFRLSFTIVLLALSRYLFFFLCDLRSSIFPSPQTHNSQSPHRCFARQTSDLPPPAGLTHVWSLVQVVLSSSRLTLIHLFWPPPYKPPPFRPPPLYPLTPEPTSQFYNEVQPLWDLSTSSAVPGQHLRFLRRRYELTGWTQQRTRSVLPPTTANDLSCI